MSPAREKHDQESNDAESSGNKQASSPPCFRAIKPAVAVAEIFEVLSTNVFWILWIRTITCHVLLLGAGASAFDPFLPLRKCLFRVESCHSNPSLQGSPKGGLSCRNAAARGIVIGRQIPCGSSRANFDCRPIAAPVFSAYVPA